jgi:hypothetical protein
MDVKNPPFHPSIHPHIHPQRYNSKVHNLLRPPLTSSSSSIHITFSSQNFINFQVKPSWMWRTNHPSIHHPWRHHSNVHNLLRLHSDLLQGSPLLSLPLLSPGAPLKGNVKTALFGFGSWVSRRCCHRRWWWVKQAEERMTWHAPPYSSERYEDGNVAPYG